MKLYPSARRSIRIQMVRCGYTKETLSERTELSHSVLQGILSGRSKTISPRTVCALARAFDFTATGFLEYLYEEEEKVQRAKAQTP